MSYIDYCCTLFMEQYLEDIFPAWQFPWGFGQKGLAPPECLKRQSNATPARVPHIAHLKPRSPRKGGIQICDS